MFCGDVMVQIRIDETRNDILDRRRFKKLDFKPVFVPTKIFKVVGWKTYPTPASDNGGSDIEQDKFTDNSDVKDNLFLSVSSHSSEIKTAADGTVTETDFDSWFRDNIEDEEKETLVDRHAIGAVSDDETFDDMDEYSETDSGMESASVATYGPVGNGARFTLSSASVLFRETDGGTRDDHGTEKVSPPAVSGGLGGDDERGIETDTFK